MERPQNLRPYLVYMKCVAPVIWLHAVITATAGSTAQLPDRIEISVCTSAISGETLSKEIFSSVKSSSDGAATLCGRVNLQQGRARARVCEHSCCLYVLLISLGRNETNEASNRQTKARLCVPERWCESRLPHRFDSFLFVR